MNRYKATGIENAFEPGSNDQVLANKLGIISPEEMDDVELMLLEELYGVVLGEALPDGALTIADLKRWHGQWLGNVYPWAGEERSVNLAKGDFHFAAAPQIPRLLDILESDCLAQFTPCDGGDKSALTRAIAITHVEFILIHPFREGNGRLGRLLSDTMAVQAGFDPLDYSAWDADKSAYFSAIQQGLAGNYEPMIKLVGEALTE